MAQDNGRRENHGHLDEEIDAKVDSLFVEGEEQREGGVEDDPWKQLKEHFLTLEWEIDMDVLDKISQEVRVLRNRHSDGPLFTMLGWMDQTVDKIRETGSDVDQDAMKVFLELKDGLLRLAEEPFQDPAPILDPLREKVSSFIEGEEEEIPTITIEEPDEEEEQIFAELDRAVDEAFLMEGDEAFAMEETQMEMPLDGEDESELYKETVVEEGFPRHDDVDETVLLGAEKTPWTKDEAAPAEPYQSEETVMADRTSDVGDVEMPVTDTASVTDEFEEIRASLSESAKDLHNRLENFGRGGDPFGLESFSKEISHKILEFSKSIQDAVRLLEERIEVLNRLDLAPPAPAAPEPEDEPVVEREDVLFVSVSDRVIGLPMPSVRGIFRVPSAAMGRIDQSNEVILKGRTVPLVPLRKTLGLAKALYAFPKTEGRVIMVDSPEGDVGLLVDQVLARQDVVLQLEDEPKPMFKGRVTVEKAAYVVDIGALS
jgi:chemotaxis protein histidine kinase CheA